jgi:acyl-CoA thioesterase II
MMDNAMPASLTAHEILQLEELGGDRYKSRHNLDNFMGVAFGGQLLGQALAAAQRTVPGWPVNSLNGYFVGAGMLDAPLEFTVTRSSDSRRFAVRHIRATQGIRAVFEMSCSFHHGEPDGVTHQVEDAGSLPDPETLLSLKEFAAAYATRLPPRAAAIFGRDFPIELRLAHPEAFFHPAPRRDFWFRIPSAAGLPSGPDHAALLAFMSDFWLPSAIGAAHSGNGKIRSLVSLNHALWFHAPADTADWLFYRCGSPWAGHGRGLARGEIFDRAGRLVATAMQEALLRSR